MKSRAVILDGRQVIAAVDTNLKNGEAIQYAYLKIKEEINANRDFNLVNAKTGKISRNKRFLDEYDPDSFAKEINPGEFYCY